MSSFTSFYLYLDADEALWHRTSSSSSSSPNNNNNPWKDVPVDLAVQQSFAAVSHLKQILSQKSSSFHQEQGHDQGEDEKEKEEFVPFFLGANASSINVVVVSEENNGDNQESTTTKQQQQQQQPDLRFIQSRYSKNSLRDVELPSHVYQYQEQNQQEQQQQNEFFSAISLPHLFCHFTDFVCAKCNSNSSNRSSSSSSSSNHPLSLRFVALLGRNAGIMRIVSEAEQQKKEEEETETMKVLNTLVEESCERIRESVMDISTTTPSSITTLSMNIVLLPKAQTFASLISSSTQQQQQQQNTNDEESNRTTSSKIDKIDLDNTDDDDVEACRQFAKIVSQKLNGGGVDVRISVDRARDCSDIGGCVSRAFLDHGK